MWKHTVEISSALVASCSHAHARCKGCYTFVGKRRHVANNTVQLTYQKPSTSPQCLTHFYVLILEVMPSRYIIQERWSITRKTTPQIGKGRRKERLLGPSHGI
eukprot:3183627-Amphidinium_carterae.1